MNLADEEKCASASDGHVDGGVTGEGAITTGGGARGLEGFIDAR